MSQHLNIVVSSQVYIWYFSKEFRHESYKVDERLARLGTENTACFHSNTAGLSKLLVHVQDAHWSEEAPVNDLTTNSIQITTALKSPQGAFYSKVRTVGMKDKLPFNKKQPLAHLRVWG